MKTIDQMNKAVTYEFVGAQKQTSLIYNNEEKIEIKFYDDFEGFLRVGKD